MRAFNQTRRIGLAAAIVVMAVGQPAARADSVLKLGNAVTDGNMQVSVPLLLDTTDMVEGFVAAFTFDPTKLAFVTTDFTGAAPRDFDATDSFANGVTLGVVFDLGAPFGDPPPVGPGNDILLASFVFDPLTTDPTVTPLSFVDGVLGTPLRDNIVVVDGLSIGQGEGLTVVDGSVTIDPNLIPTPAAMWMGLGLLAGLGVLRRRHPS